MPSRPARRELAREFPADVALIESAIDRLVATSGLLDPLLATELTLPPDGFWERREVARLESLLPEPETDLLSPLPHGHPMRAALAVPGALSTALTPAEVGTVGEARAFDQARRGLHRLEGGYAGLHALLLERLETFSGERREKVVPVEIVQKRGRAAGVRVRPRDETIGCRTSSGPGRRRRCSPCAARSRRARGATWRPACGSAAIATACRCWSRPTPSPRGWPTGCS